MTFVASELKFFFFAMILTQALDVMYLHVVLDVHSELKRLRNLPLEFYIHFTSEWSDIRARHLTIKYNAVVSGQ